MDSQMDETDKQQDMYWKSGKTNFFQKFVFFFDTFPEFHLYTNEKSQQVQLSNRFLSSSYTGSLVWELPVQASNVFGSLPSALSDLQRYQRLIFPNKAYDTHTC